MDKQINEQYFLIEIKLGNVLFNTVQQQLPRTGDRFEFDEPRFDMPEGAVYVVTEVRFFSSERRNPQIRIQKKNEP